jgi:hypothetical protein
MLYSKGISLLKVVVLLPFVVLKCNSITTFESKVYRYPRMNTQEGKA